MRLQPVWSVAGWQVASATCLQQELDKKEVFCDPKLRTEFNFEKVLSARAVVTCYRIFMTTNLSQVIVL